MFDGYRASINPYFTTKQIQGMARMARMGHGITCKTQRPEATDLVAGLERLRRVPKNGEWEDGLVFLEIEEPTSEPPFF